jgi:adenosylcobinamide-GDP ribazoletransferase
MYNNFVSAVRTLTIIPVPGKDAGNFSSSLPWFPFVGLILSAVLFGIAILAGFVLGKEWPEAIAFIIVVFSILLTGGIHLDGLADWFDALGVSHDRKRMLEVLKDPRSGVFGVLALILIVLGKWMAITKLFTSGMMVWLIAAYIVSRFAIIDLAVWLPYARSEGGTGERLVKNADWKHRLWGLIFSIVLLIVFTGPGGVIFLGFGWGIGRILGLWFRRKLGGITGDLMGTCSEIVETFLLFIGAIFGDSIMTFAGGMFLF